MKITSKITLGLLLLAPTAAKAETPFQDFGVRAVTRTVQSTPAYQLRRPEVTTGSRITVFANFLQQESGKVFLEIAGTTSACKLLQWKDNSVTIQLPKFGLAGPQDARLRIIKPNGRVAKSLSLVLIPPPIVVEHLETVTQTIPPTATSSDIVIGDSLN